MSTRHFLLTDDGAIEEFSEEEASAVSKSSDSGQTIGLRSFTDFVLYNILV